MSSKDQIYAQGSVRSGAFRFDDSVASVFTDMVSRSVPGYALTLEMIAVAARRYTLPDTLCYDLGCSLGAATLQIRHHAAPNCRIVGIDNAPAMLAKAASIIELDGPGLEVDFRCEDLLEFQPEPFSLAVLNLTLQFIPIAHRGEVLTRLRRAMLPGGCLVLSEKLAFENEQEQHLLTELHHDFKQLQGYSQMEVARKRAAIENVLIPETLETHKQRLKACGFSKVTVWLQALNFVSLLAEP